MNSLLSSILTIFVIVELLAKIIMYQKGETVDEISQFIIDKSSLLVLILSQAVILFIIVSIDNFFLFFLAVIFWGYACYKNCPDACIAINAK